MRTEPIDVYLHEPTEPGDYLVLIPNGLSTERLLSNLPVYQKSLIVTVGEDMEKTERYLPCITMQGMDVVVAVQGWENERKFLSMVYDVLEQYNGINKLYIHQDCSAKDIFEAVALDDNPVRGGFSTSKVVRR